MLDVDDDYESMKDSVSSNVMYPKETHVNRTGDVGRKEPRQIAIVVADDIPSCSASSSFDGDEDDVKNKNDSCGFGLSV